MKPESRQSFKGHTRTSLGLVVAFYSFPVNLGMSIAGTAREVPGHKQCPYRVASGVALILAFLFAGVAWATPDGAWGIVAPISITGGDRGLDLETPKAMVVPVGTAQVVGVVPVAQPKAADLYLTRAYVDFGQLKVGPGPEGAGYSLDYGRIAGLSRGASVLASPACFMGFNGERRV